MRSRCRSGINEALLKPLFPETHNLVSDWYIFNHYLLLTLYGFVLASMPGAWDWFAKRRRLSLALGLAVLLGVLALIEIGVIASRHAGGLSVRQCLHLVVADGVPGLRPPAPELRQPPAAWARDASYPVYILHQTVIIVIAYNVIQQPWGPWTKYWVVLGATLVTCVLLYEFLLRRFARAANRVWHQDARRQTDAGVERRYPQEMGSVPRVWESSVTLAVFLRPFRAPTAAMLAVWRLRGVAMGTDSILFAGCCCR